jgi:hypothetical protein
MRTGDIGNLVLSSEAQQYQQAARNWILANLRKESGAAIGVQEATEQMRLYFPQPGDSSEVIAQKARAREEVQSGLARAAGSAYQSPLPAIPAAERFSDLSREDLVRLANSYHRMTEAQRNAFNAAVRARSPRPAP